MTLPLMPKATAVWLVENTGLTFDQIAEFCGMHPLEVQGIADGEVAVGVIGINPVQNNQLTKDEITRCEADGNAKIQLSGEAVKLLNAKKKKKTSRYTPVARRQDKPDAIAWIIKNCPEVKETQIAKLIGTTKNTILSIKNRTHWNISNIKPKDPVLLGICSQTDLDNIIAKSKINSKIESQD